MCGIAGVFSPSGAPMGIGKRMLSMLRALNHRGPDSTGVALYNSPVSDLVLRIKAGETRVEPTIERAIFSALGDVLSEREEGAYLRVCVEADCDLEQLAVQIFAAGGELVSAGHALEIVKQVGSPDELERDYKISKYLGTHALGHTRMSTESKIDLSHSQPFWGAGTADLSIVHNGHITNYHKLRRAYEERGIRFYTENDSEVIGVYLRDQMARGDSFEAALERALEDFDGSFCFLAATQNAFAFVKDPYSFKPLMVAQTDDFVAVATEEIAIRAAFGEGFSVREPAAKSLQIWSLEHSLAG